MINQIAFQNCLKNSGVEFITGVPDTLLNEFCLSIEENWPKNKHIIAANEGNAAALASGYHLSTGSIPLVYMQNSGMGNTLNPLLSLSNKDVYGIPMVLLIGWRGDPNEKDHLQHKKQGELTPVLLDALDIPYKILEDNEEDVLAATKWAVSQAKLSNSPVGLIARKNVFEKGQKADLSKEESKFELFREDVIENLLNGLPKDTIFVASTGRATRELYFLRKHRGESHENDFLNIGAMGHSSSIAAGIALSQKERLVVCLDGDCAAIMHMGAFAIQGNLEVPNLLHVVMNNGIHESVGGQESVGFQIDLTQIAECSGYSTIEKPVQTASALKDATTLLLKKKRPSFIEVHIKKGMRSKLPPLDIIPVDLKCIGFKK